MMTRIYKLFATGSADANAAAQLTIQRPGNIVGVYWSMEVDSVTDNGGASAELSFTSVQQLSTNDTVGPVSGARSYNNLLTSGMVQSGVNILHAGLAIPVQAGDRLYLNFIVAGTATHRTNCYISVDEK